MALPSVTEVMNHFIMAFNPGRDVLMQEANWILLRLTAIELAVAGLVWGVNGSNVAAELFKKAFIITTFFFIINHYNLVTKVVADGFMQAGENAALASNAERGLITNPDRIFNAATSATAPIARKLGEIGWSDMVSINTLMLLFSHCLTMLAFMVLGAQVFITYLEYYLVTTLAILFLPFGVFRKTAFLAERVFQAMISFGVRMMVLTFLLGVSLPVLERTSVGDDPSWQLCFHLLFVSLVLVALALHAPSVAAGLLSGSPSLSVGDFGRTALGTAGKAAALPVAATLGAAGAYVVSRDTVASAVGTMKGGAIRRSSEVTAAGGSPTRGTGFRGAATAMVGKHLLGSEAYERAFNRSSGPKSRATPLVPSDFKANSGSSTESTKNMTASVNEKPVTENESAKGDVTAAKKSGNEEQGEEKKSDESKDESPSQSRFTPPPKPKAAALKPIRDGGTPNA